jgi:hypothetical protein
VLDDEPIALRPDALKLDHAVVWRPPARLVLVAG